MDFNVFDSRSASDEGRTLHLEQPATGELLWDDGGPTFDDEGNELPRSQPCLVSVLGVEGRVAQRMAKEAAKLPKLGEDATVEEWHSRLCNSAEKLITGFPSGVMRGDRPATRDDARWFLDLQMANPLDRGKGRSFVEQVLRFSGSRAEYLGKPVAALSEPQPKSVGKARGRTAAKGRAAKS